MKTLYFLLLLILIVSSSTLPAWASVEINAYLSTSGEPVTPQFKFSKLAVMGYPVGGKLRSLLEGQNKTVSFTEDSANNPGVKELLDDINSQLATDTQAMTTMTNLQIIYQTTVIGGPYHADIEYSVTLIPTLANYVLNKGQVDSPTVLDASWLSFDEKNPVIINSQYGDLEINYPVDFIKSQLPDVYNSIKGTDAEAALQQNLIDSSQLLRINPLDRWNSLFDPAYSLPPTLSLNQKGVVIPVTAFSTETALQSDHSTRIGSTEFVVDTDYSLDLYEKPNAGTVNVQEHATTSNLQGKWVFSTVQISTCCLYPPVGFVMPEWAWISVAISVVVVIGFLIFYFRRSRVD